jgi:REP element-mobilizing transposase RayT
MSGHRRSIRLRGHDYRKPGSYFVTLLTHQRECMFGQIRDGVMHLSQAGVIARDCWLHIPVLLPWIGLDSWVVMPDHLHGIIHLGERTHGTSDARRLTAGAQASGFTLRTSSSSHDRASSSSKDRASNSSPLRRAQPRGARSGSLGAIIAQYKGAVGGRINKLRSTPGERVWHRDYHDHLIRHQDALGRIRRYITLNPAKWHISRRH